MNAYSMSGIMFGTLSLMLSILILAQSPGALSQAMMLDLPVTAVGSRLFPVAPPVLFSIVATGASLLAWNSRIGKYAVIANLILLALVVMLFIW